MLIPSPPGDSMHHTKEKGDLGVLKAQVEFAKEGYKILTSNSEHLPFDFVVYKNKEFKRVQVKYRSLKNGKLDIRFRSCWSDKTGTHVKEIDKTEIDIFCIYCPETDECYFLDPRKFKKSVNLRVNTPKNNQKIKINLISDYRRVP